MSTLVLSPTLPYRSPFVRSRDKMGRMASNERNRSLNNQEELVRSETLHLLFTSEEMDALDDRLIAAKKLDSTQAMARVIRPVLLAAPSEALPQFSPATIERKLKLRVRVTPQEKADIEKLAQQAGVDYKRYAVWRLLGHVE